MNNNLLTDYKTLTQDQLWEALKEIDERIKNIDVNDISYNHHHEFLNEYRLDIINTFIDVWGYNPDNLCTTSKTI